MSTNTKRHDRKTQNCCLLDSERKIAVIVHITWFSTLLSVLVRFRQLKISLKKVIIELNIYNYHLIGDRQIRYQRYATRLNVLSLSVLVITLAVYTLLRTTIHHEFVLYPTESEYNQLESAYSNSPICPCSIISMNYSTFITLQPYYHQVCTSDIVTAEWIEYNIMLAVRGIAPTDYRHNGDTHFQSLSTLCKQAKKAIDAAFHIFLRTQFVGSQVTPKALFVLQINSLIREWQSTTINQNLRTIQLVRATNHGNQLMASTPNFQFLTDVATRKTKIQSIMYSNCSCARSQSCRSVMTIPNTHADPDLAPELYKIPNFFVGCFMVDALFASTLECFYNRSCMTEIDKNLFIRLGKNFNFSALDPNLNSPNQTVGDIVNRLMLDTWSSNVSFAAYYNTCAPLSCTFERQRRDDLFSAFNTIIGVFGGLSLGLKIPILIALRIVEKTLDGFSRATLIRSIKNLIVFGDDHRLKNRIHFVLVVATLSVLYIFCAFSSQSKTVETSHPSLSRYQDLAARFPDSLQCPCSKISFEYRSFLTIAPRFHSVCFSDFVTEHWIDHLYGDGDLVGRYPPNDFRASAVGQFQLLASFCQLSNETVNNTLIQLLNSDFMNTQLLSSSLLNEQVRHTVNEFQMTIPHSFLNTLSLIREITMGNKLMNALSTNWLITIPSAIHSDSVAHTIPLMYQSCDCGLAKECVQPSRGLFAGCFPLDSLFQSSLQCLHDQECIDPTATFKAMNNSLLQSSRFDVNTTIESIVNQLLVEEYSINMSYDKYFAQCAPLLCSYSYIDYANIIDGLTYIIALYGGLVIIIGWVAALIVQLFRRRTRHISSIWEWHMDRTRE